MEIVQSGSNPHPSKLSGYGLHFPMTYPILWILSVFICYKSELPCKNVDLYYYDNKQECYEDLNYLHDMQILNEEELFAELSCKMQ